MNINELFIKTKKLPQPLSEEEFYELLDKMKQGDTSARKKIAEHNIRLVLYEVTNKFNSINYEKKDIVSIGIIGLMKAIDTFNTSKKIKFSVYAIRCIDNEILMFLRKIKKDQNVDSLDQTIHHDKDGNELKVVDTLSDDIDFVEEYIDKETYQIIRKIIGELPEHDRDIVMMYFGFYNNRRYTQKEIAERFKISQSYVSRLIDLNVKKIGNILEAQGVIELRKSDRKKTSKSKEEGGKKMAKKLQTIYEYFNQYTREQVDKMLRKLTEEERALIVLRYGEDLDHPKASEKYDNESRDKFYGTLIPKMKRLLANLNGEKRTRGRKPKSQETKTISNAENDSVKPQTIATLLANEEELLRHQQVTKLTTLNPDNDEITKEDYLEILELLRTPSFTKMMHVYSPKEVMIALLKLVYIDGKSFSTTAIAEFLEIDSQEVIDTTRNILLAYKERINHMIDYAIQIATDELPITNKVHSKSFDK